MEQQPLLESYNDSLLDTDSSQHSSNNSTIANYFNLLLGLGLVSLPFAFSRLGWVLALVSCTLFCAITCWTSIIISRFKLPMSEIGQKAFGPIGSYTISLAFCCELFSGAVALLILFADSLQFVFGLDTMMVKIVVGVLLTPTTWLDMSFMSYLSTLGIFSFVNLLLVVIFDGSLGTGPCWFKPAPTQLWPTSILDTGMSLGLMFVGLDGFYF
jgi:vesicular inhibitory amino acid transporter